MKANLRDKNYIDPQILYNWTILPLKLSKLLFLSKVGILLVSILSLTLMESTCRSKAIERAKWEAYDIEEFIMVKQR